MPGGTALVFIIINFRECEYLGLHGFTLLNIYSNLMGQDIGFGFFTRRLRASPYSLRVDAASKCRRSDSRETGMSYRSACRYTSSSRFLHTTRAFHDWLQVDDVNMNRPSDWRRSNTSNRNIYSSSWTFWTWVNFCRTALFTLTVFHGLKRDEACGMGLWVLRKIFEFASGRCGWGLRGSEQDQGNPGCRVCWWALALRRAGETLTRSATGMLEWHKP